MHHTIETDKVEHRGCWFIGLWMVAVFLALLILIGFIWQREAIVLFIQGV